MAALVVSLLLSPSTARAGSYTSVTTAGTTASTVTPAAAATPTPSPTDAGATAAVTPRSPDGIPTYTIQVSPGTFTTTFTWTPASGQAMTTDPPPSCVLVEQDSFATWYVRNENGTGTGSGNPDPSLSGGNITTSTYGQANGPSQSLSATLCSQQSGASFSEACSPTASFTGTTGSSGLVSGEATVGGGASAYPSSSPSAAPTILLRVTTGC